MKETSIKAGIIGGLCGIFAFFVLFATTSKASINESAATNGDYKINRVQYEFINELTIYKVSLQRRAEDSNSFWHRNH